MEILETGGGWQIRPNEAPARHGFGTVGVLGGSPLPFPCRWSGDFLRRVLGGGQRGPLGWGADFCPYTLN